MIRRARALLGTCLAAVTIGCSGEIGDSAASDRYESDDSTAGDSKSSSGGSGGSGNGTAGSTGGTGARGELPDVSCPDDPVDDWVGSGAKPEAYATFHAIGLYWSPEAGAADQPCEVLLRRRGECDWKPRESLWFDANEHENQTAHTNQYRGSLVDLLPGTKYEVRLTLGSAATYSFPVRTMSEAFPVSKTVTLDGESSETLTITDGGSEDGYVLYTAGANGYTSDVGKAHPVNVQVDASYVIIRGLTLRGAGEHGIRLGGVDHVVVENCDISGWGSQVPSGSDPHHGGFGTNYTSGIYSNDDALSHVVIQRNRIHHPTYDTNSWYEFVPVEGSSSFVHPQGPQGISLFNSGGHHVIRYNHIYSDDEHRFNDGMGAGANFSYRGFPGRDSDIYGNIVSHVWDDAIEAEGSGMNVRVWGNYVHHTYMAFGMAAQSLGPFYLYRNLSGFSQRGPFEGHETRGGGFVKIGAESDKLEYARGRIVIYHNTILQEPSPLNSKPGGVEGGVRYSSSAKVQWNIRTRNNILHLRSSSQCAVDDPNRNVTNDFDYDLTNAVMCTAPDQGPHVIIGSPQYPSGNPELVFVLDSQSPGFDQAQPLPGFNDAFGGSAADIGAFEAGAPPLRFGLDADWTDFSAWILTKP